MSGGRAYYWGSAYWWGARLLLLPAAVLTALILTFGAIAWLIRRMVLDPLHAISQAARRIAAGNLDFAVPASRALEVAEVATAFNAMGRALRASLERQAELEQERRLFMGAVAHDLRTPLFVLRGYLEGLEQGLADTPEKAARYIAICRDKADALERLIADLFAFTRMEYLEQVPRRELLDLGALLERVTDGLRPHAEAKEVALELAGEGEGCPMRGDAHLLTRAAENLLDNALRHTPPGGRIRVEWHRVGAHAVFTVTDSGPGISPADLPHLFTPLYRAEASRNRRTGGAGLGLAIAKRSLLAHGGDLSAGNVPGGGARFTVTLPLHLPEPA